MFSDGSAVAYSEDLVLTGEQVDAAVAVIFYVGGTDGLGERILGVALTQNENTLAWAVNGAVCYNSYASTNEYDGSGNWGKITTKDSSAATTPSNYPAFQYANSYSTTGFTSGWYLPARYELRELRTNVATVNAAISLIADSRSGVSIMSSETYWSSSEYGSAIVNQAYFVELAETTTSTTDHDSKSGMRIVRPIHAF